MKYEVLIFDADETLFDFKQSQEKSLEKTILSFNIEFKKELHLNIYKEINTKIWEEFEEGLISQEKLKTERFKRFLERLNLSFDEKEFSERYITYLANSSILYSDSVELIKNLHGKFRLVIVTNGLTKVQNIRIKQSAIAQYFEKIIISEEVQLAKPDPRIFEHALNAMNYFDKSKVLMIGDSLSSDIKGGINAGIDTCWFNPNRNENSSTINPTYEISSLHSLFQIIL